MPALETMDLFDDVVLWEKVGSDALDEPILAEPVEIKVRWGSTTTEPSTAQGNPTALSSTAVVDRDIPLGSLMWFGTLEDFYGAGSAGDDVFIMEVVSVPYGTDLKGRFIRRTVGLRYFRNRLPGRV